MAEPLKQKADRLCSALEDAEAARRENKNRDLELALFLAHSLAEDIRAALKKNRDDAMLAEEVFESFQPLVERAKAARSVE